MPWFEFESETFWWFYYYIFVSCGESYLLISWCAGDRRNMAGRDKDRGTSRRPDAEDWAWSSTGRVLGDQTIERSGDAMCGPHRAQEDEEYEFIG
jgi:hypothetical protein